MKSQFGPAGKPDQELRVTTQRNGPDSVKVWKRHVPEPTVGPSNSYFEGPTPLYPPEGASPGRRAQCCGARHRPAPRSASAGAVGSTSATWQNAGLSTGGTGQRVAPLTTAGQSIRTWLG